MSSVSSGISEASSESYVRTLPLYDRLAEQLNEKISQGNFSISSEYRKKLRKVLNSLNQDQANQVALLLIHYYFLTVPSSQPFTVSNLKTGTRTHGAQSIGAQVLPFGIRVSPSGQGFSFELDQLNGSIQALLGTYCGI